MLIFLNRGEFEIINNLFGIKDLPREEIVKILNFAAEFKREFVNGKRCFDNLCGKTVALMFFENSTRTRVSFELAVKHLGGVLINISLGESSISKGESLVDTFKTIDAMKIDVVVVRHEASGFPLYISKFLSAKIINAGDGLNEHPTQALVDAMTLIERFGSNIKGLKIAIIGDILHSRVARSDIYIFDKLGAKVVVSGPLTLMPVGIENFGVKVYGDPKIAVKECDVVIALRIQKERQKKGFFPSESEFSKFFGVNQELLEGASSRVIFMHPGPANRNLEVTSEVLNSEISLKDIQVTNGMFVRMSVLKNLFK
ncbi:MAG: aspartate carbamoyltransferase catalytic subunit [Clostridiales bacterium]|jgi:aspartate carbamoyltransferase catalytic subunit|nr:aspartate carbamoyltransferase catalytic subunit [Clostridiales bacterium]